MIDIDPFYVLVLATLVAAATIDWYMRRRERKRTYRGPVGATKIRHAPAYIIRVGRHYLATPIMHGRDRPVLTSNPRLAHTFKERDQAILWVSEVFVPLTGMTVDEARIHIETRTIT